METKLAFKLFTAGVVLQTLANVIANNISGSVSLFSVIAIFVGYNALTQSNPIHYQWYVVIACLDVILDVLSFVFLGLEIGRFRLIGLVPGAKAISYIVLTVILVADVVMVIVANALRIHLKQVAQEIAINGPQQSDAFSAGPDDHVHLVSEPHRQSNLNMFHA